VRVEDFVESIANELPRQIDEWARLSPRSDADELERNRRRSPCRAFQFEREEKPDGDDEEEILFLLLTPNGRR
jgi:hypothetical protein